MSRAANNRIEEVCKQLDATPGDINEQATGGLFDGRTLLMCAASRGHTELVKELLSRGADATIVGKRSETAESLARAQGHMQLAESLAAAAKSVQSRMPAPSVGSGSNKRSREGALVTPSDAPI